jgi:hypothetical protein
VVSVVCDCTVCGRIRLHDVLDNALTLLSVLCRVAQGRSWLPSDRCQHGAGGRGHPTLRTFPATDPGGVDQADDMDDYERRRQEREARRAARRAAADGVTVRGTPPPLLEQQSCCALCSRLRRP